MWFWLRPAPNFASPHAAALASFSITTGRPICEVNSASKSTPFQSAIFGVASMVFRSDDTNPAADTPTETTSNFSINSFAVSAIVRVKATPPWRGVSFRAVARIFPFSSTTPPRTLVPPTSIPIVLPIKDLCFEVWLQLSKRGINSCLLCFLTHHRWNSHRQGNP